ncbi:hypothetical protein NGB36_16880 [Streptomyces sp. RB6PN25]|uniref:Uncharacterized protein n=1 Tax=Streptomyces humicola TaxID=2953240 RepID=A0ABT1Q0C0_9ACTN|nr:hypothetical protein [Streptomyces humicola]MCQ4082235.1 hypothetical protein [Streptomyces humicola]
MNRQSRVLITVLAAVAAPLISAVPASATAASNAVPRHTPENRVGGHIYTVPEATPENGVDGHVSFVVFGRDLPVIRQFTLTSPSLDAACSGYKFGSHTVTSDLNGSFNFAGFASGCLPGTYVVEANDAAAMARKADRTYFAHITVVPPRGRYGPAWRPTSHTAHR